MCIVCLHKSWRIIAILHIDYTLKVLSSVKDKPLKGYIMLYKVKAKIIEEKMGDYWTALNDGSIESQKPDGEFILKAMKEALLIDDETLAWYEACYCDTPLKYERESVYDKYLYDLSTELKYEIKDDIRGKSFWAYLGDKFYDEAYTY